VSFFTRTLVGVPYFVLFNSYRVGIAGGLLFPGWLRDPALLSGTLSAYFSRPRAGPQISSPIKSCPWIREQLNCSSTQHSLLSPQSAIPNPPSPACGSQSAIHNPQYSLLSPLQSPACGSQSAIRNPQSAILTPLSPPVSSLRFSVRNPQSAIHNPQYSVLPPSVLSTQHSVLSSQSSVLSSQSSALSPVFSVLSLAHPHFARPRFSVTRETLCLLPSAGEDMVAP